ncbi:unnamed protein product [Brachionus calyciflorus]|uniref:Acyl-coenzyme A thioesterase 13 n=1 Tax=Brachionus calyciflorus TaxID=104777 RepID=A0A813NNV0_9BILA|nr:unnamed protein product [Brachionus calyciflorus]
MNFLIFKRGLSNSAIPAFMKELFEKRSTFEGFDQLFTSKWKIVSAPENQGSCLIELKVDEKLINMNKTIHGGALASLLDISTTVALYNTPIRKLGVSVDLNISYMKPAKLNETILIDGKVVRYGSKLAFLEAKFYLKEADSYETKKELLIATGSHTKFIV